jgi:hypothetical protein
MIMDVKKLLLGMGDTSKQELQCWSLPCPGSNREQAGTLCSPTATPTPTPTALTTPSIESARQRDRRADLSGVRGGAEQRQRRAGQPAQQGQDRHESGGVADQPCHEVQRRPGISGRLLAGAATNVRCAVHGDRHLRRHRPRRPGPRSEYTSEAYKTACRRLGVPQSMGRVGSALDNAAAEAFNSTIKVEYIHRHRFATCAEARIKISTWIVDFHNLRRRTAPATACHPSTTNAI